MEGIFFQAKNLPSFAALCPATVFLVNPLRGIRTVPGMNRMSFTQGVMSFWGRIFSEDFRGGKTPKGLSEFCHPFSGATLVLGSVFVCIVVINGKKTDNFFRSARWMEIFTKKTVHPAPAWTNTSIPASMFFKKQQRSVRPQYGIHSDGFNELWCGILCGVPVGSVGWVVGFRPFVGWWCWCFKGELMKKWMNYSIYW